ncbi:MaoC/PaaZ C-terminal domain-containing protein [Streptomyces sp. NPDC049837]|uniref:MaoC family dehydratase n=1 Tax=Streptomyces sp. NPDC049837 TaxID=3155277 RepID=UPI00341659AF
MNLPLALALGALRSPFRRPGHGVTVTPGRWRLAEPDVRIDPDRLAAYARVCGFSESGPVPLPYPHVLGFPLTMRLMAARDFPLPLLGLVHTWITVTRHRALLPAERLQLTVHVAALTPHRRGTEVTVATEAHVAGEPVWESRSGYLARHGTPDAVATGPGPASTPGRAPAPTPGLGSAQAPGPGRSPGPAPGPGPAPTPDPGPAPAPPHAPLAARAEWRLASDLGRRYGRVSGDRNPIHLHPLSARVFGFPRPIAHGMWTFARCVAELSPPHAAHVEAEFRAPVPLPSTVTYAADGDRFELRGDGGRPYLTGTATSAARP